MSDNTNSYGITQTVISVRRNPYDPQSQPMTTLDNDGPFYIVVARPSNLIADDPRTIDVTIQVKDGSSTALTLSDTGILLDDKHIYSTDQPVSLGQGEITIRYTDGSRVAQITLTAFDHADAKAPGASTQAAVEPPTQPIRVRAPAANAEPPTQPIRVKPLAASSEAPASPTRQAGYAHKLIASMGSNPTPPSQPPTAKSDEMPVTASAAQEQPPAEPALQPPAAKSDEMPVTASAAQEQPPAEPAMQPADEVPIPVTGAVEGQMALTHEGMNAAEAPVKPGPTQASEGTLRARPLILRGMLVGAAGFLVCVALAYAVYNFGLIPGFSMGGQPPAAVVAATPVDGSKPGGAMQTPAAVNSVPTQVDTTPTGTPAAAIAAAPVIELNFNQTQLDAFPVQLSDLVVLDPNTTWSEVNTSRNLADWATAGTAQGLTAAGDQHVSGTGFRSQNSTTGTAMVTSTVHEFASSDAAQKGVAIMAADAKTTLANNLVIQATVTLRNGVTLPVSLVTGSQSTGTYAYFIASYNNMVVNVAAGGFDSSPTGLSGLVTDSKTLGQQMLNHIEGAAPLP